MDSAVSGIVTFFITTAVLLGLEQPVGMAVVPAIFAGYFSWQRPASLAAVATALDRRHGLADLLSSAWAVRDSNEPWAASLRSMADATAATLPPSPWPGLWTVRRSACGLATAAAVLLAANLIPTRSTAAEPIAQYDTPVQARPNPGLESADMPLRAADTASSQTHLPSEHESAANGQAGSEPAQAAAKDANGDGRANSKQASSIEFKSSSTGATDPSGVAGGNRITEADATNLNSTGMVRSKSAESAEKALSLGRKASETPTADRPAAPLPAGYRDLISDFFAR